MVAYSEDIPFSGDALCMAALSLIKALTLDHEAGFQKLVVEFTNTQLKTLLNSAEECLSELNNLIVRIRALSGCFTYLSFLNIPGSCNKVTKLLACSVKENTDHFVWFELV